jgi:SAM-dependent methyltransferase
MDKAPLADLRAEWKAAEQTPFSGWDFSHLRATMVEDQPPWSYDDMARGLLRTATSALDLGTGGGERLFSYRDVFPPHVTATEGHPPNLALARKRLAPLGIEVFEADSSLRVILPLGSSAFDLVIARHSAFNADEVERVLAPGGIFLSEQVDGNSNRDLIEAFGSRPKWPFFTFSFMLDLMTHTNLVVDLAQEWTGTMTFSSVAALVYFLKAVPWLVEGFSVDTHFPYLIELQKRLEREGRLAFMQKLMVVRARKPAG